MITENVVARREVVVLMNGEHFRSILFFLLKNILKKCFLAKMFFLYFKSSNKVFVSNNVLNRGGMHACSRECGAPPGTDLRNPLGGVSGRSGTGFCHCEVPLPLEATGCERLES